ncbi:MAG: 50S ribosomal protein L25 [Actinomycetota bacterium]|nr:50S ribosomal protein L25 [Actinomycetota bacterium]
MAEITLVAEAGRPIGSRAAGRLRAAGRIPAVIYGHGRDPLPVSVDGRDLRAALTTASGLNALLSLKVGDDTHLTLARELQRHPVRSTVTHVDFLVVRRDEIVSADVPIVLVGEARLVAQENGIIEHTLTSLPVNATPDAIPSSIELDISAMAIGDTIRVGDVALPSGVTTEVDPDEAIVIAQGSAVTQEVVAEEAAAETDAADAAGAPSGG